MNELMCEMCGSNMVTREGGVQAANVTMYEKPVKVNANVIEPTLNTEKKLLLNK